MNESSPKQNPTRLSVHMLDDKSASVHVDRSSYSRFNDLKDLLQLPIHSWKDCTFGTAAVTLDYSSTHASQNKQARNYRCATQTNYGAITLTILARKNLLLNPFGHLTEMPDICH